MKKPLIPLGALRCLMLMSATGSCGVAVAAQGITGDWNGARERLASDGIELDMGYTVEAARNLSGGLRHTSAHAGQLSASGQFDLQRLWGWEGTRAAASLSLRDGHNLTERAGLGSLLQNQEIYGRGNIARLGSLWLAKQSADGQFDLKLGRVSVGDDFNALDCIAMNLALCGSQPAVFGGDYWFNSPLSQWGGVFTWRPMQEVYVRAGAYQVNPRYADTHGGGLRLAPSGTVGTLTPLELGWEPTFDGRSGHYAVGGWYSSARRADAVQRLPVEGMSQQQELRTGAYGGWASAQQQLTRGSGANERSGLRGQVAFAQGDRRTGDIDQMFNVQLIQTGLMHTRPDDRIGIGLATTRVNPRAARSGQQGVGTAFARREHMAEVFYGWKPLVGVDLQPGIQFVRHPGGFTSRKDAVVVGMKADVRF